MKRKTGSLYANTRKQSLDKHLFAVGYLAYRLLTRLVDDEKLAFAVFVAGCLHDIGKLDPEFQRWLEKATSDVVPEESHADGIHIDKGRFTFENHARHNEISLLIYHLLNDVSYKGLNKKSKNTVKHVLYWHHAKPIRRPENEFTSLHFILKKLTKSIGTADLSSFAESAKDLIHSVNALSRMYFDGDALQVDGVAHVLDDDVLSDLDECALPAYKKYSPSNEDVTDYVSNVTDNAKNNLARASVIAADQLISALTHEQLSSHIQEKTLDTILDLAFSKESSLSEQIQVCLDGFGARYPDSHRSRAQAVAANQLVDAQGVCVLNGPAGCGKTKIALEWAAKTEVKKIIWVCPRVQVCQGLFLDLTNSEYLPDSRIEIHTGEFKFTQQGGVKKVTPESEQFSGDIVITTIDQLINTIVTHRGVTSLIDYMASHVVFDEFHEYINMPAFNLLFAELIQCKQLQGESAKALLVSATPNYFFVEHVLEIDNEDVISIDSFNMSKYRIAFMPFDEFKTDATNPFYQAQPKNTFVISNTATTAQLGFIERQDVENALLFHSKYKQADKLSLFETIFESFKYQGSKAYEVLRSGPVVQASLNITCDRMVTEFTHAENLLQRLGRLDRFGVNTSINDFIVATPYTIVEGGHAGSCERFLKVQNAYQSAYAWYQFLQSRITDEPLSIHDIYVLYQEFYASDIGLNAVSEDLLMSLKVSVRIINAKVHDPVSIPNRSKSTDGKITIKKSSLRGDNRFVQMAVCAIRRLGDWELLNEYACAELVPDETLTASMDEIMGYGDSTKSLLVFMSKKHHNIKARKKAFKDSILLNEARSAETPIYLSYTPDDLKRVEAMPHSRAIYYAIGNKQPIGAISLIRLTSKD